MHKCRCFCPHLTRSPTRMLISDRSATDQYEEKPTCSLFSCEISDERFPSKFYHTMGRQIISMKDPLNVLP
jgi:hypothetical protein